MTSMKLTKLLILALGLMALMATAGLAQDLEVVPFTATGGAPRIIATNSDTGETATIVLTSLRGDAEDPAYLPGSPDPQQVKESIYFTYTHQISALSDIFIRMQLPGPNADLVSPFTAYNQWQMINNGSDIARARVGIDTTDRYIVQIQFLDVVSFYEGSTIELSGVRVDLNMNPPGGGEEVFVDFTTAEGSAIITNNHVLVARSTDPLYCEDCEPQISFRQDGRTYDDVATITIGELFHNAFEKPSKIQLYISNIPTGFEFEGIEDVGASGNVIVHNLGCGATAPTTTSATCYVWIEDQNPGVIEEIYVGLRFDMIGIPDFEPNNASVRITLYPSGSGSMPWVINDPHTYPLRYSPLYIYCDVLFDVDSDIGGELLSVFNVADDVWDTGIAIMNGSGAEPLKSDILFGHWWDIPQNGAVEVWMYPMYTYDANDPFGYDSGAPTYSPYTFTTSGATASVGLGLDVDGRVPNRGTWAVLVSQLCENAKLDSTMDGLANGTGALCSASGDAFEGFIVFRTYFPSAEGVNFLADWGGNNTQAHGYAMINLTRQEMQDEMQRDIERLVRRRR